MKHAGRYNQESAGPGLNGLAAVKKSALAAGDVQNFPPGMKMPSRICDGVSLLDKSEAQLFGIKTEIALHEKIINQKMHKIEQKC